MRLRIFLVTIMACCTGCTHLALERRTVNQASTLTDLQYQQVLDNLAMFACNNNSLAWHVKIKGGTIQVTDQAGAGFGASIATALSDSVQNLFMPSAAGQRTVLQQWDVDPTIEGDELEALQLAYQKAIDPFDQQDTIHHAVLDKICEICLKFSVLPRYKTFTALINGAEGQKNLTEARELIDAAIAKETDAEKKKLLIERSNLVKKYIITESFSINDLQLDIAKQYFQIPLGLQPNRHWLDISNADQVKALKEAIADDPKTQLLTILQIACDTGYLSPRDTYKELGRNPGLIDQAQDKIKTLEDLIEMEDHPKFNQPWLCIGEKKAVPKCACYVGHYCNCGCDCYVWVTPEHMQTLRDFTIAILTLAPPDKQDMSSILQRGGAAVNAAR